MFCSCWRGSYLITLLEYSTSTRALVGRTSVGVGLVSYLPWMVYFGRMVNVLWLNFLLVSPQTTGRWGTWQAQYASTRPLWRPCRCCTTACATSTSSTTSSATSSTSWRRRLASNPSRSPPPTRLLSCESWPSEPRSLWMKTKSWTQTWRMPTAGWSIPRGFLTNSGSSQTKADWLELAGGSWRQPDGEGEHFPHLPAFLREMRCV